MKSNGLSCRLNGKGRVAVHAAIARLIGLLGCVQQIGHGIVLGHQSVNALANHCRFSSASGLILDCGSKARNSKMEIMGKTRMKSKNANVKNPRVPRNVM